jgi:hypothetical protein
MGSAPIPGPAARKLLIGHSALEGQSQGRFDHAEWCIVPPCNAPCSNHSWPQHCSYRSGASRTSLFLMEAPGEDGPIVRSALSKKFQHGADHPAGGGRRAASHAGGRLVSRISGPAACPSSSITLAVILRTSPRDCAISRTGQCGTISAVAACHDIFKSIRASKNSLGAISRGGVNDEKA